MTIAVRCGKCGKGYKVGDDKAGKRFNCKKCAAVISIPASEEPEDEWDFGEDEWDQVEPTPPRLSRTKSSARRNTGGKKRKRSKQAAGVNPIVYIGAGAGLLVVALLVGGMMMFGGGDDSAPPQNQSKLAEDNTNADPKRSSAEEDDPLKTKQSAGASDIAIKTASLTISPDGSKLVTYAYAPGSSGTRGTEHEIKLWDLRSASEILTLDEPHRSQGLAISRNGLMLVSAGVSLDEGIPEVKTWDLTTGKVKHKIAAGLRRGSDSTAVGFSQDGTKAYCVLKSTIPHRLGIVDLATGNLEEIPMITNEDQAMSAAFSPVDETAVVSVVVTRAGGRCAIDVRDLSSRKLRHNFQLGNNTKGLTFSANGRLLAGSVWGKITIWETTTWKQVAMLDAVWGPHDKLAISPDGQFVAALVAKKAEIWDVNKQTRRAIGVFPCLDIAFTLNGVLVVASQSSRFMFFDPVSGNEQLLPTAGTE